jgi:hypothetical protein
MTGFMGFAIGGSAGASGVDIVNQEQKIGFAAGFVSAQAQDAYEVLNDDARLSVDVDELRSVVPLISRR